MTLPFRNWQQEYCKRVHATRPEMVFGVLDEKFNDTDRTPHGGFVRALLAGDLDDALWKADGDNATVLAEIIGGPFESWSWDHYKPWERLMMMQHDGFPIGREDVQAAIAKGQEA